MTNFEQTIKYLKNKFITLDTNIFLLLVIGSYNISHVKKFKRTNTFTENDYYLLLKLIKSSQIILTPNIITEASNLLESYHEEKIKIGLIALKKIIKSFEEKFEYSDILSEMDSFLKFGLTDSSINRLCRSGVIAITVDLPLFGFLSSQSLLS
ncbi:hypothetical protein BH23BAC1_BH23BAC1_48190 [soil metagenome]